MIPALETPRLWLRPLELTDAEQVQRIFPKWEIVRLLTGIPWPYPPDGALQYYSTVAIPAMARGLHWHWTLRLKNDPDKIIGAIALMADSDLGSNRGFWLDPTWQHQGLMSEAVEAVNRFWFETLGRPRLRTTKAAANLASRKISERTGMRLVAMKEATYTSGTLPAEVWEITAEEWRAHQNMQHR